MNHPRIIRSQGIDIRYCAAMPSDCADARDALALNPLAPAPVVQSAALNRVARIRDLCAPFSFTPPGDLGSIPAETLGAFIAALGETAQEAVQMLEHALTLHQQDQHGRRLHRAAARLDDGGAE